MDNETYMEKACATLANRGTVDMTALEVSAMRRLVDLIDEASPLADELKKRMFNRDREGLDTLPACDEENVDVLSHSWLGIASEMAELNEAIVKVRRCLSSYDNSYYGLVKEYGDLLWYIAIGLSAIGSSIGEAMQANIDKLQKRYPNGYSHEDAVAHRKKTT